VQKQPAVGQSSCDKLVIDGFKKLRESKTQDYPMNINSNAA